MILLQIKIIKKGLLIIVFSLLYNSGYSQNSIIQGRLTFSNRNPAKGYKVIIVPNTRSNDVITNNRRFNCDDMGKLKYMKAMTSFTTSEGKYYFKSVPAGRYILKVCTQNGYRYNFIVNDNRYSVLNIKDLPATY